jgi:hypothetical protein
MPPFTYEQQLENLVSNIYTGIVIGGKTDQQVIDFIDRNYPDHDVKNNGLATAHIKTMLERIDESVKKDPELDITRVVTALVDEVLKGNFEPAKPNIVFFVGNDMLPVVYSDRPDLLGEVMYHHMTAPSEEEGEAFTSMEPEKIEGTPEEWREFANKKLPESDDPVRDFCQEFILRNSDYYSNQIEDLDEEE